MSKIVVATDFSENSLSAANYALELARVKNREVIFVHAYKIPSSTTLLMKNVDDVLEVDAKEDMEEFIAKLPIQAGDIVNSMVINNDPVSAINDLMGDYDNDLYIIGAKGLSGIEDVVIGSVAQGLVNRATKPILVVPPHFAYKGINKIVFATDFETFDYYDKLAHIREIAEMLSASVDLVYVAKETESLTAAQEQKKNKLLAFFGTINVEAHIVINKGLVKGIKSYVEATNPDVLALVARNHGLLASFFRRSLALEMASKANIPLLAIHE